jgi:HEAT repeat protein
MAASAASADSDEDLLASPDFVKRMRGVNEVRTRCSTASEIIGLLVPLIAADSNPQVRYVAVSQVAGLNADEVSAEDGKRVLDVCLSMLSKDTDPSCQAGAADAIAALKLRDGFDALVDAFNSTSDWMLRFTIASGIGVLDHPRSFEFLTAVLEAAQPEGDELLITATIGALADLGTVEALPIVGKYLDHPDVSVKERAKIAHDTLSNV